MSEDPTASDAGPLHSDGAISFPLDGLLDPIFPFHLLLDRDLAILDYGPSIGRVLGLQAGDSFAAKFNLIRPDVQFRWEALLGTVSHFVLLESQREGLRLRGQFLYLKAAERLLFIGSPWLASTHELTRFGLKISDFAEHDPTIDMLHAQQSSLIAVDDADRAVKKLRQTSERLRAANAELTELTRDLAGQRSLLAELGAIQRLYITEPEASGAFSQVLRLLLAQTGSVSGFIGTVRSEEAGGPLIELEASIAMSEFQISDISGRSLELADLARAALNSSETMFVHATDGAQRALALLPVRRNTEVIGLVGLLRADAEVGPDLVARLEPVLATCATLIDARRIRRQGAYAAAQVELQTGVIEQKDLLIQEVHHRVKNNLQVVSSLLSLQMGGRQAHPDAEEQLRVAHARISAIAVLHEMLYRSRDLASIALDHLVAQLVQTFAGIYGDSWERMAATVDIPEGIHIPEEQAGPLTLILNELITNAGKHAFPVGWSGTLRISARLTSTPDQGPSLELTVADDGVGLHSDTARNSVPGLGLKLLNRLTEQLGGSLRCDPAPVGTCWSLLVPLEEGTEQEVD